jgi:hypothetical protein
VFNTFCYGVYLRNIIYWELTPFLPSGDCCYYINSFFLLFLFLLLVAAFGYRMKVLQKDMPAAQNTLADPELRNPALDHQGDM